MRNHVKRHKTTKADGEHRFGRAVNFSCLRTHMHPLQFLCSVSFAWASCLRGTTLYERDSVNQEFGYTNRLSPLNWANMSPDNIACATSSIQSPINLDETIGLTSDPLEVEVPLLQTAKLTHTTTSTGIVFDETASTIIDGERYRFRQFHFHTPSEHRVHEEYFPVEMHMVHEHTRTLPRPVKHN